MRRVLFIIIFSFLGVIVYSQIIQSEDILSKNGVSEVYIESEFVLNKESSRDYPFIFIVDSLGRVTKYTCDLCEYSTAQDYKHNRVRKEVFYNVNGKMDSVKIIRPFQYEDDQSISFFTTDTFGRVIIEEIIKEEYKYFLTDSFFLNRNIFTKNVYDSVFYYPSLNELIKYKYLNDSIRKKIRIFGFSRNRTKHETTQLKLSPLNRFCEWQNCTKYTYNIRYYLDNGLLKKIFLIRKNKVKLWKEYNYEDGLIKSETTYDIDNGSFYNLIYIYEKNN